MRHYRIEFLDEANKVVHVRHAEARSRANAFLLVVDKDWPRDALTACVVDTHGRRGPSVSKPRGQDKVQGRGGRLAMVGA